jgi:hypothetical protein
MPRALSLSFLSLVLWGLPGAQAQFFGKEVFEVGNAEQLLKAVGSDRTIRLAATAFTLSDVSRQKHAHVHWDGKAITIHGVKNLRVLGATGEKSEIVTRDDSFVLAFEKCRNVDLRHLSFRHERPAGKCTSAVLGFVSCTNTLLRSCQISGCGTEGLTLSRVDRFEMRDSTIRDGTVGIMSVQHSANVLFQKCRFENNGKVYGVDIQKSYSVLFEDSAFRNNTVQGDLLAAAGSAKIAMTGGELTGNRYRRLRNRETAITIDKVGGLDKQR